MTARAWVIVFLLALGGTLVLLDWPATLTDEDEYMPHALADIVAGDDPYTTPHEGSGVIERPWGTQPYSWETTYPYLPMLLFLQVPGVDYRWVALAAYGALLLALRPTRWGFWAFANPVVALLAASGFNDFVPFALLAWSTRVPWLAWIAASSKQFFLPLIAFDCLLRRDARPFLKALGFAILVCLPFALRDTGAFFGGVVGAHVNKLPEAYDYWNYWLYPLYAFAVIVPETRKGYGGASVEPTLA